MVIGIGSISFYGDNPLEVAGSILRITIQDNLTLAPGYANRIRTGNPRGFNEGHSSKFREGSRVRQTPEEGRRTYRLKRCGNNNSPKTLNDKKPYKTINMDPCHSKDHKLDVNP